MGTRLKVVMLTTSYPRWAGDSAGHFIASLAEELAAQGHAVTVIAPHARGARTEARVGGVSVRRFRYAPESLEILAYGDGIVPNLRRNPLVALTLPVFALAMRRSLRMHSRDADVIHVHWAPTLALAAPRASRTPVVLTLHGSDTSLAARGGLWRSVLRRGLRRADAIIAVAATQVTMARDQGFAGPAETMPSGVPDELTSRVRGRDPGQPARILYVGRLIESKGVGDLLSAFISSAEQLGDARLTFVGDGPMRAMLSERASASPVAGRIRFEGAVSHERALEHIAGSDLLVLPSHAEGSPLSVTEALALGTPVLGTPVGGVPELVQDAGEIVDVGDTQALADALVRLLSDRSALAARGAAARARIAATLTWPTIASRTDALYRVTISGRSDAR